MNCIFVSQLHEFYVSHYLVINNSKIIIYSLIEHHMINYLLYLLSFCSDSLDPIYINVFKQFVNLVQSSSLLDQLS